MLRHRLRIDGAGALVLAAGFFLAVTALTVAVSFVTEIRISGWEVGTQLVRWFVGAIGVYLTAVHLPLYLAHGRTRREVARALAVFGPLYAALVGVLVAVGYALERGVYAIAGWPQRLDDTHLYSSPTDYPLIALEHALVLVVWLAAGALAGAAFYRAAPLGIVAVLAGIAAIVATEVAAGPRAIGPFSTPLDDLSVFGGAALPVLVAVVVALACAVALAGATWMVVRDLPVRPRST